MVPVKDAVRVNFAGGINTKTDPKQIDASEFLALNNMAFTAEGQLTKRNGFAGGYTTTISAPNPALTFSNVGASLTNARKIFSYNDELLLNDAFNLYSWDASSLSWNYKGRSTVVGLSTSSIVSNITSYKSCDSSIDATSGVKIFAYWSDSISGIFYTVQDTVTGQFIINQASFGANFFNPRCVSIAGKSWIFAVNSGDNKIYYQAFVGQNPSGSPTALITNLNAVNAYDVDVDPNTGNIYIAYYNTTPGITISALSTSMVVGNSISKSEVGSHGVSWFGDGTNIWVVYNNSAATKAFVVNNAVSATVAAPTVIDSGGTAASVNNVTGTWSSTLSKAFIFYDQLATDMAGITEEAQINFNSASLSGATITPGTANVFMGTLSLNSKAFSLSGIPHVVGLYTYPTNIVGVGLRVIQPTNFLLNLYNVTPTMGSSANNDVIANIAGKISADEASQISPVAGLLAGVHQSSSGVWEMALLQNSNYGLESQPYSPLFTPTGVIDCKFDFNLKNPDVQSLGQNAITAGAQAAMYDSARVVEQNFHIYPNVHLGRPITSGGGMGNSTVFPTGDTTYGYIFTYEWIDNEGQVHRSFPSPVTNAFASGHDPGNTPVYTFPNGTTMGSVTFDGTMGAGQIPCLRVTNKPGTQVVINIYRTTANGSIYYLIFPYGTLLNDPSTDFVSYTDTIGDPELINNLQLYTTGALGYYAPPATSALTNFKNRTLAVASEDPYQLGYSNEVQQNFPVQFVPEFLQNIGTVGGPLVTVAQMDDKIILFKNGKSSGPAIYYMVGNGPAPSGANNDFQDPLPIAVSVGNVDRSSVILTDEGLMFKSDKGIYLLNRALQASYIGAPVEAYNQYSVLAGQLIPNSTQVRFILSNGVMLMYDYFFKKWATWTPPAGVSDCIFRGRHTYVDAAGQVYQETPGLYVDGTSTPVLMSFTTAWIKLAGLVGYQRAYFFFLLASYISPHKLGISLFTDFSATPDSSVSITPDSQKALENWRVFFSQQRCQSFQIQLSEIYTGTPGAGFTMSGLNLIAGAKNKFRTISAAQSVG